MALDCRPRVDSQVDGTLSIACNYALLYTLHTVLRNERNTSLRPTQYDTVQYVQADESKEDSETVCLSFRSISFDEIKSLLFNG